MGASKRRPRCLMGLPAVIGTLTLSNLALVACRAPPASYGTAVAPSTHPARGKAGQSNVDSKQQQREALFEAYNLLHSLAQDFHKPFDSPAVLVVGHQTSGKSALIEGLMGFQFNQVGGGTKTRRPIALRMQYNPDCDQPVCHLTLENGREEPRTLSEIQAYIEMENRRLERDPMRNFDPREIVIRMEYRFCPNMILIDTPGLIQAPRGKNLNAQQRELVQASQEAEALVIQKMRCQDYVILCLEDTTDWKHATTRNIVMKVDPDLSRTVLVTTKLDTKLPQFGTGEDLEDYLSASELQRMHPNMLGGPFYTTVPSGRVGSGGDAAYMSNEAYVQGVRRVERDDQMYVSAKLGQQAAQTALPRVGLTRLRAFLELHVEECYRRNVARIVPLLQRELGRAETRLLETEREMHALSVENLKSMAEDYRDHFVRALGAAIQGTIKAPPETYGETLEAEQLRAGCFLEDTGMEGDKMGRLMEVEVGNGNNKLFGGAQYHRALREFAFAVRHMPAPAVTEDEIANAAGVGDVHDGVNFMRAACVIAVEKARIGFEPLLESLRVRTVHVMKRLFAVVEFMLQREGHGMSQAHQKPFSLIVRRIYEGFVEGEVDRCLVRCKDDLRALTRFVTWDLHERSAGALHRSLPDSSMVQVYSLAVDTGMRGSGGASGSAVMDQWQAANVAGLGGAGAASKRKDYIDLMQLMEEASCTRNAARTSAVVSALVRHIMVGWRDHFSRSVAMKFNCFFLMPFIDDFPCFLRNELDKVYQGDVTELFNLQEARSGLERRREELVQECRACHQIQGKFDAINQQLSAATSLYEAGEAQLGSLEHLPEDVPQGLGGQLEDGWSSEELGGVRGAPPPKRSPYSGFGDEEDSSQEEEVMLNPLRREAPPRSTTWELHTISSKPDRGAAPSVTAVAPW